MTGAKTPTEVSVGAVVQKWLEQSKNRLKITSYLRYESIVKSHLKRLEKLLIARLTSDMIVKFTDELLNDQHLSAENARFIRDRTA